MHPLTHPSSTLLTYAFIQLSFTEYVWTSGTVLGTRATMTNTTISVSEKPGELEGFKLGEQCGWISDVKRPVWLQGEAGLEGPGSRQGDQGEKPV